MLVTLSLLHIRITYTVKDGMGKMNLTPEQRQERSERMKALHAQGKAGAEFGKLGGRPKKPRASELVADKAREDAELFYKKLRDVALYSESEKFSIDAIKHIHFIEEQERKITEGEEVKYEQLKHAELAELVIGNFFELIRSGSIDLAEIIDAEIVEDRPSIGSGEADG
jgi:hypothetical protein